MISVNGDEGARFVDCACDAHCMIDDYSLEASSKGGTNLKVTFNLLGATDRAQVGKSMSQLFPLDGGGISKTWDLIEAARIVPRGTNRKQAMNFDETLLKGRQVCAKIHLERGQTLGADGKYYDDPGKPEYARIGFNALGDVYDQKFAAAPKDPNFLALWPPLPGQSAAPAVGQAAAGQAAPPQSQQPKTAAPAPQQAPPQQGLPLSGPPSGDVSMNW